MDRTLSNTILTGEHTDMTDKNKKLTDFNGEENEQSTEESADTQVICDYYVEKRSKNENKINELDITVPKCGYSIDYLCSKTNPGTADAYSSCLKHFINYIHQQGICIEDVTFVDVRDFFEDLADRGLAHNSVSNYYTSIKDCINRYEAENKKTSNVSFKISENIKTSDYSTGKTFDREPLSREEVKKMISASGDIRNKLMILTIVETGPRNQATCRIKLSDVNLEEKLLRLHNTKYDREYMMPLSDNLVSLLDYWIKNERSAYTSNEDNPYLFPSRRGGRLTTVCNIIRKTAEDAGIQEKIAEIPMSEGQQDAMDTDKSYRNKYRVDTHSLRHTFSRLAKNGEISREARKYALDHETDVTEQYGADKEACREEIRNKFTSIDISDLQF